MFLPKIYPITDTKLTQLTHAEQVKRLTKGGAEFIQLREKYASSADFYESAKEALEITRMNDAKLLINDRVDIALTINADGVHLGQEDLPPEKAREVLGEKAIIGFSTHSIEQAKEALNLPINYIAIGPIFATNTKEKPDDVVGIEGLRKARKAVGDFPLVAIGGINFENYKDVLKSGADSVAIISGILSEANKITQNYKKYISS